jgi:hypothetical protein
VRSISTYEVHPGKDHRGVDLISDVLPFGRLWYHTPENAIGYAMHNTNRSVGQTVMLQPQDIGRLIEQLFALALGNRRR